MSHDSGIDMLSSGGGHRRRRRRPPRFGARRVGALVAVGLVVVALVFAYNRISDLFDGPGDYSGTGTGSVVVQIPAGANGRQIADLLEQNDVVKTADAFYQVSLDDERARSIQPGFFQLRQKMSAESALEALIDPKNRVEGKVTIPEGSRVGEIVDLIAKNSEITEKELAAALSKPESLGLPDVAKNNPEGYLFPATYVVEPGTSAVELLRQMVQKTVDVAASLDIAERAEALGLSTEQVLTVASILEYEAKRDADYPKVARVLYNRLDADMPLQLDSTVSYVSKRKGDVFTTPAERADPSAYNTYQNTGLPPGPIGSPGEKTIEAALNPADGSWLYFVAINLETGETVFSDTLAEHNKAVEKLKAYCRTAPEGVCG